jgi:ABC-type nitrate/sulfonate/bicarbonate transport system substrate-binding protein
MYTKSLQATVAGLSAVALGVCLTATAATGSTHAVAPKKQLKPEITQINYETYPGTMDFAELAKELGYLPQLTLNPIGSVTGGPAMIQAVATGQTVYGHAGNTSVISAVSAGAPLVSVLTYSGVNSRNSTIYYVLKTSSIKKPAQLENQKVALNTLGAIDQAAIDQFLSTGKLSKSEIDSVQLVQVPSTTAAEALENGNVQAAPLTLAQAAALGNVKQLFNTFQLYGKVDDDEYVMNPSFIQKYPNTTHILVAAMAKALVWAQTHPLKEVRSEYVAYLQQHNRPDEVPYMQNFYQGAAVNTHGGVIKPQDFTYWLKWMKKFGFLTGNGESLKASSLYTNKFNPYATS